MAEVSFWHPLKTAVSCYLFIIIMIIANNNNNDNFHQLLQMVFSECTEAIATSLIPLETILPEKCAFIIGFSCTVMD